MAALAQDLDGYQRRPWELPLRWHSRQHVHGVVGSPSSRSLMISTRTLMIITDAPQEQIEPGCGTLSPRRSKPPTERRSNGKRRACMRQNTCTDHHRDRCGPGRPRRGPRDRARPKWPTASGGPGRYSRKSVGQAIVCSGCRPRRGARANHVQDEQRNCSQPPAELRSANGPPRTAFTVEPTTFTVAGAKVRGYAYQGQIHRPDAAGPSGRYSPDRPDESARGAHQPARPRNVHVTHRHLRQRLAGHEERHLQSHRVEASFRY